MEIPAMSAQIISLQNAKRSRVRCPETGVVFPQLYRLTGFHFKLKAGRTLVDGFLKSDDDLEADLNAPTPPAYTLDAETLYGGVADPKWEPIHQLDTTIDDWLVYIRHHASGGDLEAYIDAMCDTETYEIDDRWLGFHTEFGSFSVLHRNANRDAPNCALVYVTKIGDPLYGGTMDWHKVIGSDGEEMDIDDLNPPEVQEQMAPIKNLAK